MSRYKVNKKEIEYVNILLKWFESQDLSLFDLMNILDYEIPLDINNYKLFIILNSMGWWYDSIETFSKNEILKDKKFLFFKNKLKKFYV